MKILKLLFKYGQLNTSGVAHKLGINYKLKMEHLELLETENIIQHRLSGGIRLFRFANTKKARATIKLLEEWEKE